MNEAERRFRARADRFKRDLNQIVFQAIDRMVAKALKDTEKQEADEARAVAKAAAQRERERAKQEREEVRARAKQEREEERARLRAAKEEVRRAKAEAKRLSKSGAQLEFRLGANGLRTSRGRAVGPTRVREDSILGAELAASIDLSADIASGMDGLFSRGPAGSPPLPKSPTERPLFVHKRARDGRIHALSRGNGESEESPKAAAAGAAPAIPPQGGSAESG